MIISSRFRGTGLGRKLLEMTEKFAIERGFSDLCLSSNGTEKFYEKCGFFYCSPVQQSQSNKLNEKLQVVGGIELPANTFGLTSNFLLFMVTHTVVFPSIVLNTVWMLRTLHCCRLLISVAAAKHNWSRVSLR